MTDAPSRPVTPPATKRWRIWLLATLVALLIGSAWLLASSAGLKLLTAAVSRSGSVTFAGVSGSLLASPRATTLIIDIPDLRITARDIGLSWRPAALLSGKIEIKNLTAREVEVLSLPSPYPDNLRLPLALSLQKLDIATLRVFSKQGGSPDFTASNVTASLTSNGRLHRLHDLQAQLDYGKLTASGEMDGTRPYAILAQAELAGLAGFTGLDAKEAHISATVIGTLMKLEIKAKGSGAGLTGTGKMLLTPYAPFPIAALKLQAAGLNPRAFSNQAAQADLTLQVDLRGNATGVLEGDVTVNNLSPAPLDRDGLPLQGAHAHARISPDLLQLDNLTLALTKNASISGNLSWQRKLASGSADLSVHHLDPAELDTRLRATRLDGNLKLTGSSAAQRGILVLSDGTLHLDAHLAKAGDTLTLDDLRLNHGQAALTGKGSLKLDGQRAYRFNGRLHRFDLAAFMHAPHSDLNATLDATGFLAPKVSGNARFLISDSRLADQPVTGHGLIAFSGTLINQADAQLRLGDNQLNVTGGLGAATDRLQLDLAAPALQQFGAGYGGKLIAHASLAGSLTQPDASFEAEGHQLAIPGDHHLDSLSAVAGLHGDALTLSIKANDYRTDVKTIVQSLLVEVHGSRTHHELAAQMQLYKDSTVALHAAGGLSDLTRGWQNIQWQGALNEFSGTGALPFKLQTATPLAFGPDHLSLDAAKFDVAGGALLIDGVDWTQQRWRSQGSFTGIGVRAGTGLKPGFTALDDKGVLRLGGQWNVNSAGQSSLRITRESGDWVIPGSQPIALGLHTLQLTALAANGRLSAEMIAQGARLGDWRANIALPLVKSASGFSVPDHAPLTGKIHLNVSDLAWLAPAVNENLKSAGRLALEADVTGTVNNPSLLGQMRGDDLSLAFLDQGVRLQQGQLVARFDREALHIDTLSFAAPHDPQPKDSLLSGLIPDREPGKLSASGVIAMTGKSAGLDINARHLPLSQRPDRWIIASGSGHIGLNKNLLTLIGNITADAGLISQTTDGRPVLSDDIVIKGRQTPVARGPHLSVDATLNLGEHFYLRTSGLEARLAGQLKVHDAPGLRVTGSIAALDATFEAYGQRLSVERGIVNFQGPLYDPGLNILAVRRGLSVEAGVEVTGTALHPSVKLVSTPAVPDVEKLSWIVLGRAPSSTGSDSSMLLSAAGGILGGGSGGITGQLKQALGVDELSLRQDSTSSISDNPLSSQIVTVGKRLSSRAFISYAQGVTAVAGVTKLTYILTPRVNIVTQAGVDNAIDVFYTFSFD